MLRKLRLRLADLARRSAFGAAGGAMIVVAAGFFTAAAWHGLRAEVGPVWSAMILGAAYLLLGLIALLFARGPEPPPPPHPEDVAPMDRVVRAFLDGMAAGSQVRRSRR